MRVVRFVSEFPKEDEYLRRRIHFLQEPSLAFLQQLVGAPAGDLLYEEVELDALQVATLAPLLEHQPDTAAYVYFLSCAQE